MIELIPSPSSTLDQRWNDPPSACAAIETESSFLIFDRAEDFSRKYICSNAYLPTPTIIINAVNAASQGRFILARRRGEPWLPSKILNAEVNHGRILGKWDRRLATNVTPKVLIKDFPSMTRCPATIEAFRRKWRYLFAYATSIASLATFYIHFFNDGTSITKPLSAGRCQEDDWLAII
ncbi:hypothetical protein EDB84DRAFT_1436506 [Lactarius hengduanensis]|nr:hypothetical protein EDB84DRAFT_1436506 [Lactarius hengduanensis]